MNSVAGVLQDKLSQLKHAGKVYLAFSGGLDSSVLFHLLVEAHLPFIAVHVNHQISVNAGAWQQFCESQAQQHNIPIRVCKVSVENTGRGLEDAARVARYTIFEGLLEEGEIILSAHHANDQAETLLFRLMRGAGLKGLASIAEERSLGKGKVLRPLLSVPREDLVEYASQRSLRWIEDESNEDEGFDRNYLRAQIIPGLLARWPAALTQIANSAKLIAKETALLEEYAELDYLQCRPKKERQGESLDIAELVNYSLARRHNLLRYWMHRQGFTGASVAQLNQLEKLLCSRADAIPELVTGSWCFRRFAMRLYLLPASIPSSNRAYNWDASETLVFDNGARLSLTQGQAGIFTVKFREGGERCKPLQREHSQTLKKLLQEYNLEPWWRDVVPLIYRGETLFAVGDLFICDAGKGYSFCWQLS